MQAIGLACTLKSTYLIGIIIFSAVLLGVSQQPSEAQRTAHLTMMLFLRIGLAFSYC